MGSKSGRLPNAVFKCTHTTHPLRTFADVGERSSVLRHYEVAGDCWCCWSCRSNCCTGCRRAGPTFGLKTHQVSFLHRDEENPEAGPRSGAAKADRFQPLPLKEFQTRDLSLKCMNAWIKTEHISFSHRKVESSLPFLFLSRAERRAYLFFIDIFRLSAFESSEKSIRLIGIPTRTERSNQVNRKSSVKLKPERLT